jgi:hypothetical protein
VNIIAVYRLYGSTTLLAFGCVSYGLLMRSRMERSVFCCFKLCVMYVLLSFGVLLKLSVHRFRYGVVIVSIEFIHIHIPCLLITNVVFPNLFKEFPFFSLPTVVTLLRVSSYARPVSSMCLEYSLSGRLFLMA